MKDWDAGFTLAEVLITLLIIGIVASLTIPALLNNIGDAQYKAALKKTYSNLSQVILLIANEHDGTIGNLCDSDDYTTTNDCFNNVLKSHLKYIKACTTDQTYGNCWPANIKQLNGRSTNTETWKYPGLVLADGTTLILHYYKNCDNELISPDDKSGNSMPSCGDIYVDVNGPKTPNTIGKDIFYLHMLSDSMIPFGFPGDSSLRDDTCIEDSTESTNQGISCAAKYLTQ